jgi:hypothetical protein
MGTASILDRESLEELATRFFGTLLLPSDPGFSPDGKLMHCKRLTRLVGRCCSVSHSRYAIYGTAASVAAPLWHARCALFEPLCF